MSGGKAGTGGTAAVAALVAVTFAWGTTFVVVKQAIERIPVMDFLAWRFTLAAVVMVALRPRAFARLGRLGQVRGAVLGIVLGAAYVLQTFGLRTASAAVSGFVTGMFVVFTPLCAALLLRRRVTAGAWAAVALATAGLALLALRGLAVGGGELLTLGCAVGFALHIVALGEWSADHDAYGLAVVQLATVAAGCWAVALPAGPVLPPDAGVWFALALTSVVATAFAFVVQTWAQARISATRAAVVMTMEPVFAGLFAVTAGGERLGPRRIAGSLLILVAMIVVEAGPRQGAEGDVSRLEV